MRRNHHHRLLRAALLAGLALLTAAAMAQPATATSTIPAPERWLPVALGTHSFGHLRSPDAIVAKAGPDQVGFWSPPGGEGESYGPDSFDVARDGSIWLVDREFNGGRLLVWPPGQPSAPARTVTLPFGIGDFAVAPDGTIYVTYGDKETPVPGLTYHLGLAALSPTGQLRWKGPTIMDAMNAQLRLGPDGALYWAQVGAGPWTQLVTRSGRLLSIAEQRQRTYRGTLVSGGLQLVMEVVSPDGLASHDVRVALVNQAGQVVLAWRITSQNGLFDPPATPALVGGDPVLAMTVRQQTNSKILHEYLVLRLAPNGGTRLRFALDAHAAWGDSPKITELRVGPDGQLYQLRSNPAWGVRIARYSLAPKPTPPPTTITPGGGPVPPSTLTPPPATNPPAATVTPPTSPPVVQTAPADRSVLPWVAAIAAPALAAAVGGWWWYRRRHPTGPRRHGRPHPAH